MVSHSVAPAGRVSEVGASAGSAPHVPTEVAVARSPPSGRMARNRPRATAWSD